MLDNANACAWLKTEAFKFSNAGFACCDRHRWTKVWLSIRVPPSKAAKQRPTSIFGVPLPCMDQTETRLPFHANRIQGQCMNNAFQKSVSNRDEFDLVLLRGSAAQES